MVYATNMERISSRLWHPTSEEVEQEEIHKEEVKVKQQIANEQLITDMMGIRG